jgi:hypothetical protein
MKIWMDYERVRLGEGELVQESTNLLTTQEVLGRTNTPTFTT